MTTPSIDPDSVDAEFERGKTFADVAVEKCV
jgi:hypothetical protein